VLNAKQNQDSSRANYQLSIIGAIMRIVDSTVADENKRRIVEPFVHAVPLINNYSYRHLQSCKVSDCPTERYRPV